MNKTNRLVTLADCYIPIQKLNGWEDLQRKASCLAAKDSPLLNGHQILTMGACVAKHECIGWPGPVRALFVAHHYGDIVNLVTGYVDKLMIATSFDNQAWRDLHIPETEQACLQVKIAMHLRRTYNLPIPSNLAMIAAMTELWPTLDTLSVYDLAQIIPPFAPGTIHALNLPMNPMPAA